MAHGVPISRRGVLGTALGAVLAAGAGTAAGYLRPLHGRPPVQQPNPDLVAALAAEKSLVAQLDASGKTDGSLAGALSVVRADHEQHAAALEFAIGAVTSTQPTASPAAPKALTRAQLAAAEAQAATHAAARAMRLSGRDAALLASIAACEQTHRELLA